MGLAMWRWGVVCGWLLLATALGEEGNSFSGDVKASLVFREDVSGKFGYPHCLLVYLRLENVSDDVLSWTCDSATDIEAELFDGKGNPVIQPPTTTGFTTVSSMDTYCLPCGSRLDWMISHGGVSVSEDNQDEYLLVIGGSRWLIPPASVSSYSLKIRVKGPSQDLSSVTLGGKPGASTINAVELKLTAGAKDGRRVLLELPATSLVISRD